MHKFTLLLISLVFASCLGDSNPPVVAEQIVGDWTVIEATRNNRMAKSLQNSEFYISDSTFSTNFLPDNNPYPYSFDGKKINVLDPANTRYSVKFKTSDTLILRAEIRNFDFKFTAIPLKSEEVEDQ